MPTQKVDIVFLIDASDSMTPCFEKLKENLKLFLKPLQDANFTVRYGLLAYSAGVDDGSVIYRHRGLDTAAGGIGSLYSANVDENNFFTPDQDVFLRSLASIKTAGDEDTPVALDIAADFPFAPIGDSRRAIALFSNEKIEDGVCGTEHLQQLNLVLQKIAKRKISLYAYIPGSEAAVGLSRLPKSIIRSVPEGPNCWDNIDFGALMEAMGKSISVSTLQMTQEPEFQKAIYGQDQWVVASGVTGQAFSGRY